MGLLDIKNLRVRYISDGQTIHAVNDIDLTVDAGKALGLVGETGAGKTTTALSVLRLVMETSGSIEAGEILFDGNDLLKISEKEMRSIRGNEISMIFQDPMTALNPIMKVVTQISEVIQLHKKCSKTQADIEALEILEKVGIKAERGEDYPHQFSGGMKQRVVIAIALACRPKLLIADEPTTALDVTIQAQVLKMINELKKELNMSLLLITHDLGVVAETCDNVAIMYAGEIVEFGTLEQVFENPQHPYTLGLFQSIPDLDSTAKRLRPIPGMMPDPSNLPEGCKFHPRCPDCTEECTKFNPGVVDTGEGHLVKCLKYQRERRD